MWPTRKSLIDQLTAEGERWDIVVVGGGATGVGVALDAASRGYRVALLEQHDFGKGTSSRSTKLIHGGVRYLAQGNVSLVREALRERAVLCQIAPHLVHAQSFIVPAYRWWHRGYYRTGMRIYDWMAGRGFEKSRSLSRDATIERLPTIESRNLRGGVLYYDAAFDDSRLLIDLVKTAIRHSAVCLNYVAVRELKKTNGRTQGVIAEDVETGATIDLDARVVINATGPFADGLRQLDDQQSKDMIVPSQGSHIVLDRSFLPGSSALIVPKTRDGRVMFAIPWQGRVLIGTTDIPVQQPVIEPKVLDEEVDFLLDTSRDYLSCKPTRGDIRSIFSGIRPLVRSPKSRRTSRLSRSHAILVSDSQLLTISGGKWTTYRQMAEDCVDRAASLAGLSPRPCITDTLCISGNEPRPKNQELVGYGDDAEAVQSFINSSPSFGQLISSNFKHCIGEVAWFVRREFARTVEDALARRTRMLFLDAQAAIDACPRVAEVMASELGYDEKWQAEQIATFRSIASGYICGSGQPSS